MRDSCGLKAKYRWRGEHTCRRTHTSKQSHTHAPGAPLRIPAENGSLQGQKCTKRQTHTERVSAGNRWKLALIALFTSDPEVKRYGNIQQAKDTHTDTHLCALFFTCTHSPFGILREGLTVGPLCVCVEGREVTSHHMEVRITTSWIHFDVRKTEGRQRGDFQGPASNFMLKTYLLALRWCNNSQ